MLEEKKQPESEPRALVPKYNTHFEKCHLKYVSSSLRHNCILYMKNMKGFAAVKINPQQLHLLWKKHLLCKYVKPHLI